MKIFVQRKYKKVYEEYCMLYERMVLENPSKRDLCKSNTFYQFLVENPEDNPEVNPEGNPNNIDAELAQDENNTNGDVQTMTANALFVPRVELEPVVPRQGVIPDEEPNIELEPVVSRLDDTIPNEEPNILVQALSEIIEAETVPIDSVAFDDRVKIVNNILSEMKRQAELRGILGDAGVNLKEGEEIELDYFDEFEKDIQPFNFELEVEPFDF